MPTLRSFLPSVFGALALASCGEPQRAPDLRSTEPVAKLADVEIPAQKPSISLSSVPLRFEANAGQWDSRVLFLARDGGETIFLTDTGATIALSGDATSAVVEMRIAGQKTARFLGEEKLETKTNYFLGNDKSKWRGGVANFARVRARDVVPGVDVLWHSSNDGARGIEYDLAVAPNVDATKIALEISGADAISVRADGSLEIKTPAGALVELPPKVTQDGHALAAHFVKTDARHVAFAFEGYDKKRAVYIDPTLAYSTYLGGNGSDSAVGVAVDSAGNAYVAGSTSSTNFPGTGAGAQTANGGGGADVFVAKLNATGSALTYATYLGGSGTDYAYALAVDSGGNATVVGSTQSTDFPATVGAAQTSYGGGAYDGFVAKLNAAGSALTYATYLGGSGSDATTAVVLDATGNAYVTGQTASVDFPATAGGFQTALTAINGNAFVASVSATGATVHATYLGGSDEDVGNGIALYNTTLYVAGTTYSNDFPGTSTGAKSTYPAGATSQGFLAEIPTSLAALTVATYIGGSTLDEGRAVAVDSSGYAYVAGDSGSSDFAPAVGGAQPTFAGGGTDGILVKISPSAAAFTWGTYLGGSSSDLAYGVALDGTGAVYVSGLTHSSDFPTKGALAGESGGGFLAKVASTGASFTYSTYLGISGADSIAGVAVDTSGNAYAVGTAGSSGLATVGAFQTSLSSAQNALICKISTPPLAVLPTTANVFPRGSKSFTASGGTAPYSYSINPNNSLGSIDGSGNYTAGIVGSVTDTVKVSDSAGGSVTASVTVGPVVTVSPSGKTFPPLGPALGQIFTASGGNGSFTYTLQTNASNGSIDPVSGKYFAGNIPNVVDVILATDGLLNTGTVNVNVGAGVSINPTSKSLAPKGTQIFTPMGGAGAPYTYTIPTNNSGSTFVAGLYTAGTLGGALGTTDTVQVADALGNYAQAVVTIGAGISIVATPSIPVGGTPPKSSITFSASGGSGSGFTWSVTTTTGATINSATGVYKAGAAGNTTDTVKVTDSLGNTATISVPVSGPLVISPLAPSVAPRGTQQFSVSGGSGLGISWSAVTPSGGNINAATGLYTAGTTGNKTDTITVTDSLGNTASTTVSVTVGVTIVPATKTVPPRGSITFSASGGSNTGFTYAFVSNGSGAMMDTAGNYVAGPTGSKTDTVRVTDSLGNTATATITVSAGVSILPASPSVAPLGTVAFSASGGSGTGFSWIISVNNSVGTINAATGAYKAGATGSVSDTVTVTDSLGNTTSVNVSVGGGLAINPVSPSTPPKGPVAFHVSGGSGTGYVWSILTNNSVGSIVAATGAYTAGATGNVTDTVKVVDSLGNTATMAVTVGAGISLNPTSGSVAPLGMASFAATGGSGTGYVWTISQNNSAGTITATGGYQAGTTGSVTDTVKVTDSLGNVQTASVTVSVAIAIAPKTITLPPRGSTSFSVSGGAGGYSFVLQTNASGGNVSASGGSYTAGQTGSVTDVVKVTDQNGASSAATVTVGPVIAISPAKPAAAPLGTIAFSATGGAGAPFSWNLVSNNSGGSIDPSSGAYIAGPRPNVTDQVQVLDALGNVASVNISVGSGLAVNPANATAPPRGTIQFSVTGGAGGYVWSLETNVSGAEISATSGKYVAGATGNVSDIVRVTDSAGAHESIDVAVSGGVAVSPNSATVKPGGTLGFNVSGGSGKSYAWSLASNASGATIDPASGEYTAGTKSNVTDIVSVDDSLGNSASATVSVTAPTSTSQPDAGPAGGDDGGFDDDAGLVVVPPSTGCGCTTVGTSDSPTSFGAGAVALFAAAIAVERRRRRRARNAAERGCGRVTGHVTSR